MERRPTRAPTRQQFASVIERARAEGKRAAEARHLELTWQLRAQEPLLEACGTAMLIVKVDSRSHLGRLLRALVHDPIPGASVTKLRPARYMLHVQGTSGHQGESINVAAELAVLTVLKQELGIEG